jgi:hypothetical protein
MLARVDLTFASEEETTLSKGTRVWTKINDKKVYFYLDEEIHLVQNKSLSGSEKTILEKIVVNERASGIYDRSSSNLNEKGDLFFAPFGNEIQKGCALYLGFVFITDKVPDILGLMCYIYEKDLIEVNKYETNQAYEIENPGLKWEFWTGCNWNTVVPQDKTQGFRKSGKIVFNKLEGWTASRTIPELGYNVSDTQKTYFWLRCLVEDAFYEYPPRIENLRLNTVSAIHGMLVEDNNTEIVSNGLPGQVLELRETPVVDNTLKLSIEEWVEVQNFKKSGPDDKHFVLDKEKAEIKFGNGNNGLVPPKGYIITFIKYLPEDENRGSSIDDYDEWISKGSSDQSFKLKRPPAPGTTFKLSVEKDKWVEVNDFETSGPYNKHFVLNRKRGEIKFGNGTNGLIPSEGSTVMVMKYTSGDREKEEVPAGFEQWTSTGLPDQIFKLKEIPILGLEFKLLVEEDKWIEVDDFEGSGPSDKHFVLDKEIGEIKFGDGLMGLVPSQGSIIRVLEYMTGGGEEGNLMPERSWEIEKDFKAPIKNYLASTGGKEAQTIEEAIEDLCRDLKTPYTAVTLQDFEQLAMSTPGLRISRAKAISDYKPKQKTDDKELEKSSGSVTVVIIPYTPLEVLKTPPEPSEDFKKAVCVRLDKHRILGTDVHVISPIYCKVIVNARIVPMDTFRDDSLILEKILEKLNRFLHPVKGGVDEKGWPIGRGVYLSEIYNLIENIEGVNCVLKLSISGDKNASSDADGNLILKKLASVYSGAHSLEIFREKDQCFKRGDSHSGK